MSLCLGTELAYVENARGRFGSNKFYKAVLAGDGVFTCYGRRHGGNSSNYGAKSFESLDAAAADFWRLVRAKVGKGYQVVDAAVFDVPDAAVAAARVAPFGFSHPDRVMIEKWDAVQRGERRRERQAILNHPDRQGRSPRTPREGKALLVALMDPECPREVLMECALASPEERFLVPMGLSHPGCPDDVRVAHFLNGGVHAVGAVH